MNAAAIDKTLRQLAVDNKEYAVFNRRVINTNKRVYGVRVPVLRHLAKQLVRYGTYQAHYLCDTFISSYANPIDQADNFH